jgi:aminomethyltransferase
MTTPLQSAAAPLAALLRAAAIAPLDDIGWIRITGSDRVRWLNGMATNNIQALKPGEGCYNFFLNAQGRIQGDATAWMLEDSILLETAADRIPALMAMLDHFIIMDDVELADLGTFPGLTVAGPQAPAMLAQLGLHIQEPLHETGQILGDLRLKVHRIHSPLVPRFELWPQGEDTASLATSLTEAGLAQTTPEALDQLRILEGTPRYGTDITDRDLPQETGQTRALHFTKGCYLGQEIVERIHSRGNVHRSFSGFVLTGPLPAPGTQLEAESTPVAELTSVASIHLPESGSIAARATAGPVQLALGIIRRETLANAQACNLTLTYPGGTATPIALPYAVP